MKNSGVTLVELCLACSVIAVVAAISWPSLNRFAADSKLENEVDRFAALVAYARDSAVIEGCMYRVSFDASARSCEVSAERDSVNGPGVYASVRDSVAGKRFLPEGLEIGEISGTEIHFDPDGTSEDFHLVLRNSRGTECSIDITGHNGKCLVKKP